MEPIRVFVGTEPNQYIAQEVLGDSIRKHASQPVEIHNTFQNIPRVGGTHFGFVRLLVPSLCGYSGKAIYLDADMVVLADIAELWNSLSDDHTIALVKDAEGVVDGKPPKKINHTSVMVMNCEKLRDWNPDTMFNHVVPNKSELKPGEVHYSEFVTLKWFDQDQIQALDPRWNHLNIVRPDTKLVHFTHVTTQPWRRPSHELTSTWLGYLKDAMKRGGVKRSEVIREVFRRHVHPRLLLAALS
jgi:lipopolysaccharide biosynthesis glycosyltransferase